jgi:hypothetical protein
MRIIAVILLIVGLGLSAIGGYGYFFSADYERCARYNAAAEEKLKEARAAQGTPREAATMEEARLEVDSATRACRDARGTAQWTMLVGLGGVAAIIISVVLIFASTKRSASA